VNCLRTSGKYPLARGYLEERADPFAERSHKRAGQRVETIIQKDTYGMRKGKPGIAIAHAYPPSPRWTAFCAGRGRNCRRRHHRRSFDPKAGLIQISEPQPAGFSTHRRATSLNAVQKWIDPVPLADTRRAPSGAFFRWASKAAVPPLCVAGVLSICAGGSRSWLHLVLGWVVERSTCGRVRGPFLRPYGGCCWRTGVSFGCNASALFAHS